jgi:hypothetical protein
MLMIADTAALLLSCCVLLFLVLLCWCTWWHMDMLLLLCWRTWKRCCCSVVKRDVKLIDSPSEFTNPPSTTPLVVESRYKSSFYHVLVESRFTSDPSSRLLTAVAVADHPLLLSCWLLAGLLAAVKRTQTLSLHHLFDHHFALLRKIDHKETSPLPKYLALPPALFLDLEKHLNYHAMVLF